MASSKSAATPYDTLMHDESLASQAPALFLAHFKSVDIALRITMIGNIKREDENLISRLQTARISLLQGSSDFATSSHVLARHPLNALLYVSYQLLCPDNR